MNDLVLKFPTAAVALKMLDKLQCEVRTAKTLADLARIMNAAEA